MRRVLGAAADLVHDPATGLTHRAPRPLPAGRVTLDDSDVNAWPVVPPATLDRTTPVSVCWSPLVRCNLSCPHCLDDTTVPELRAAERLRVAAVLAGSRLLGVDVSGGEPLLLRDLPDLARTITAGGVTVSVTTNGWHLRRRAPDLVGAVDAVRVSLDGPDQARHDARRGQGSFARAVDGIRAAVGAGLPAQIQTVLMASTRADAPVMVDLADRLGVGGLTFLQMLPIGAGAALAAEPLDDDTAAATVAALDRPPTLRVRLRTRASAAGFTVVRADGRIWRNDPGATGIQRLRSLRHPTDLALTAPDGSA